jgi:hypothetical protein
LLRFNVLNSKSNQTIRTNKKPLLYIISDITTNTLDIGVNEGDIATNDINISINSASVSANASDISDSASDISSITTSLEASYWVSVSTNSFVSENTTSLQSDLCKIEYGALSAPIGFKNNASAGSADCDMVGGIQLPDKHTILSLRCGQFPNTTSASFELKRTKQQGSPAIESVSTITAPPVFGGHVVNTSSIIQSGTEIVDNMNFSYFFFVDITTSDFTSLSWGITGCAVEVQPPAL